MNSLASRARVILLLFTMTARLSVGKSTDSSSAKCTMTCNLEKGFCEPDGTCSCFAGWNGKNCNSCEVAVGCRHGMCQKPGQCLCKLGYGGRHCQLDLKYCERHQPCRQGGVCENDGKGSYTCDCPEGFSGKTCAVRLTEAIKRPVISKNVKAMLCLNGGHCSRSHCKRCLCPTGFAGIRCQVKVDLCVTRPCANGATCRSNGGNFYCECSNGFVGKHCDQDVNECSILGRGACENGGKCLNLRGSYTCRCPKGFEGVRCEKLVFRFRTPDVSPTQRPATSRSPGHRVLHDLFQNRNNFYARDENTKTKSTNMKVRHSVVYSHVEIEAINPDVDLDDAPSPDAQPPPFVQILTFSLLGAGIFISLVLTSVVCSRYCKNKKSSNLCRPCFHEKPPRESAMQNNETYSSIVNDSDCVRDSIASQMYTSGKTIVSVVPPSGSRKDQQIVDDFYVSLPEENATLTQNNTKQSSFSPSSDSRYLHDSSNTNCHCNNYC